METRTITLQQMLSTRDGLEIWLDDGAISPTQAMEFLRDRGSFGVGTPGRPASDQQIGKARDLINRWRAAPDGMSAEDIVEKLLGIVDLTVAEA